MFTHTSGHETLTERIIGCAIELHSQLGPGLLEAIYDECLSAELSEAGLTFERHRCVPVVYKGQPLSHRLVADFIVEGVVLVEVKAVETIAPVHLAQVVTYLKLTACPVGLLMNFNVPLLRNGVRRAYNPAARNPC